MVYSLSGLAVLGLGGILINRSIRKTPNLLLTGGINLLEMTKELPKALPASIVTPSEKALAQRIERYKTNVEKFISKERAIVKDRGSVVTLPWDRFHSWQNAAKRMQNVTK